MDIISPCFIQRASLPWKAAPDATLSRAVSFDYMGSSEFEFGMLPRSLRALAARAVADASVLVARPLPGCVDRDGRPLLAIGLPADAVNSYAAVLQPVLADQQRTQERTGFEDLVAPLDELWPGHVLRRQPPKGHRRGERLALHRQRVAAVLTRFWWDLDNDVMLSFEPDFMAALPGHLRASWLSMTPPPATPVLAAAA